MKLVTLGRDAHNFAVINVIQVFCVSCKPEKKASQWF